MLATKPVATLGTSCARTAVSASAPSAVVVGEKENLVRLGHGFLRHRRHHRACRTSSADGGGKRSPDLKIALVES